MGAFIRHFSQWLKHSQWPSSQQGGKPAGGAMWVLNESRLRDLTGTFSRTRFERGHLQAAREPVLFSKSSPCRAEIEVAVAGCCL